MATPKNKDLYEQIKNEVYTKYPKHSAYRSMLLVKKYKNAGGEYEDKPKKNSMTTTKWLGQKWTDANEYYHTGIVKPCGSQNTIIKYDEYPLCRPLQILQSLSHEQLGKMIENKKSKKPLITKSVLGTDEFNIKHTKTGMGKESDDFLIQLNDIGLNPEQYLKEVKKRAKRAGYNPNDLYISDKNKYKLVMIDDEGKKHYFGRVNYNDYIIYQFLEKNEKVPKGTARQKRRRFHISHELIKGNWRNDKYSPNNLALRVNW